MYIIIAICLFSKGICQAIRERRAARLAEKRQNLIAIEHEDAQE
jgi:hypothetical protein